MTTCFFVKSTDRAAVALRRYVCSESSKCPVGPLGFHNAENWIAEVPVISQPNNCWGVDKLHIPHDDPRWPSRCAHCDYIFTETDDWQEFRDRIWSDGFREWRFRELPVGAMYLVDYLPLNFYWDNKTDPHLHVITPGGTWNIDSRASNCTMPNDRLHRCWVRHGVPPQIHVDKAGLTCSAGAGSIQCGDYHGFLHNGSLT